MHSVVVCDPFPIDAMAFLLRAVNADLFRAADLSFAVESLPLNQPLASLPIASASRFSAVDSAFNSSVVGLHTALPLGDVVSYAMVDHGSSEWGCMH